MDTKIFLSILLIVGCCYCMVARAQIPDCCLTVRNKTIERSYVVDYRRQLQGHGCSIDATILLTRHWRKLCVPLAEPWVQPVITYVDKLKEHCKRVNFKGRRCFGVKRH